MNSKIATLVNVGGFAHEPSSSTCSGGLGYVVLETETMTIEERVSASKKIMDAMWHQPLRSKEPVRPHLQTIADLLDAINQGWKFNANEADNILIWFGDVRAIRDKTSGEFLGAGVLSPDGSVIRDGRDLVDWRDQRWSRLQVSKFLAGFSDPAASYLGDFAAHFASKTQTGGRINR